MTTFTVWKFDTAEGAANADRLLRDAESEGIVTIVDHAIVSWPHGEEKPSVKQRHTPAKRGAATGALWGLVGGLLFAVPVVGGAVGAAVGAMAKKAEGTGITQADIETIRTGVVEGTSALFLVTEGADLDRLGDRLRGPKKLVHTNLTDEERRALLETFGGA